MCQQLEGSGTVLGAAQVAGTLLRTEPHVWASGRGFLTFMAQIPAHPCSVFSSQFLILFLKLWYLLLRNCWAASGDNSMNEPAANKYEREIAHSQSQLGSFSSRTRVFVVTYNTAHIHIVTFSASKIAAGSHNGIKYVSISWCSAKSPITSRCSATGTSLRTTDLS